MSKTKSAGSQKTAEAVLEDLKDKGVKYMQIEVPDMDGMLRGKIVQPQKALAEKGNAFCTILYGLSTQDDVVESEFSSFENGFPDMFTTPDMDTVIQHPWHPERASVICDIISPDDDSLCVMSPRTVLQRTVEKAEAMGFTPRAAVEYEIFIMHADNDLAMQGRHHEMKPLSRSMNAYSLIRLPDIQDVMEEYIERMKSIGIEIDAFHCELGTGQFEFALSHAPALEAADKAARAKIYLKQLCAERNLAVTFMSKWKADETGTGAHVHQSLWRGDEPAFSTGTPGELSKTAYQYAAGMLHLMPELTAIFNPVINSYRRRSSLQWCPENASWADENRTAALRAISQPNPKAARLETRQPGGDANPYLTIAACLASGLYGIENEMEPPAFATGNAGNDDRFRRLPTTLQEAINLMKGSDTVREILGSEFVDQYLLTRQLECNLWEEWLANNVTEWEVSRYFDTI